MRSLLPDSRERQFLSGLLRATQPRSVFCVACHDCQLTLPATTELRCHEAFDFASMGFSVCHEAA